MTPLEYPLLVDENIHPDVVRELVRQGKDVVTVFGEGLGGHSDAAVLRRANADGRVVLTHDADFGTLAVRGGQAFTGIVYLRPGHISSVAVLQAITAVDSLVTDVEPPFIVVAETKGGRVRVRIRFEMETR